MKSKNSLRNPSYSDLILAALLTFLFLIILLLPSLEENFILRILTTILVLFIPGYVLTASFFPRIGEMNVFVRISLSIALSISITAFLVLFFYYTAGVKSLDSILIIITVLTYIMILLAFQRRKRLSESGKFSVPFVKFYHDLQASFQGEPKKKMILSVILIILLVLAMLTTVYIIINPLKGEPFTEFYLLGSDGKASNYPTDLSVDQQGQLIIGVVNHEGTIVSYRLVVKMNGNVLQDEIISLPNNGKEEIPFTFTADSPGQKKLEFLLYKLPNNQKIYRSLHLLLNVT
jgi:uncharacterized membrane protein